MNEYPCLFPVLITNVPVSLTEVGVIDKCPSLSEYFAKNNKAAHGHICKTHYEGMTEEERKDYELG